MILNACIFSKKNIDDILKIAKIVVSSHYLIIPYLSRIQQNTSIFFFVSFFCIYIYAQTLHSYAALMTLADLRWSAWYVRDLTVTLSSYLSSRRIPTQMHKMNAQTLFTGRGRRLSVYIFSVTTEHGNKQGRAQLAAQINVY